jgi:hypothetical protein
MVGPDCKNLCLSLGDNEKENRSQGSGGKQGEISLTLKVGHF